MTEAFYLPGGDVFVSTPLTRGPWSADAQHAGPPAALLARSMELLDPPGMTVARFTMEVLRPIPVRPLRVETRVIRPGRRVQLVESRLGDEEGEIARAAAWRIGAPPDPLEEVDLEPHPFPSPEGAAPAPFFEPPWGESYFTAMDWRTARGDGFAPGPAAAWMRMRVPLVAGEEPRPLSRVLVAADSGNGISWVLPLDRYLFVNTELTVHLARMPEGEWVCLDATTRVGAQGAGIAESVLWDQRGRIGRGNQSLLVAPRG